MRWRCRRSSSCVSAALLADGQADRERAACLRVEAAGGARGGVHAATSPLDVAPGRCLALAGPSGAGKSTLLRDRRGPACGRTAAGSRCGDDGLARHRGRGGPSARSSAAAATSSRTTRCSRTCASGRTWPTRCRAATAGRPPRRCSSASASKRAGRGAARDRSRAASVSGSPSPAPSRRTPRALLLDEPLSALDARTRASATRELAAVLRDAGVPALLVTHDFAEAAVLGDEVAIVDAGRVVQQGAAAELAAAPSVRVRRRPHRGGGPARTGTRSGRRTHRRRRSTVAARSRPPTTGRARSRPASSRGTSRSSRRAPPRTSSARNRLEGEVVTVTAVGGRVRVGLDRRSAARRGGLRGGRGRPRPPPRSSRDRHLEGDGHPSHRSVSFVTVR